MNQMQEKQKLMQKMTGEMQDEKIRKTRRPEKRFGKEWVLNRKKDGNHRKNPES